MPVYKYKIPKYGKNGTVVAKDIKEAGKIVRARFEHPGRIVVESV